VSPSVLLRLDDFPECSRLALAGCREGCRGGLVEGGGRGGGGLESRNLEKAIGCIARKVFVILVRQHSTVGTIVSIIYLTIWDRYGIDTGLDI
jgi:hypothetical protein